MKTSDKEYAKIIVQAAQKGLKPKDLAPDLWKSLYRDKALDRLDRIFDLSKKLLLARNNQLAVNLESANKLTDQQLQDIKLELEQRFKKEIIIEDFVNKELGSGIRVIVDDKIIDLSSQHQIEGLIKHIKG